MDEIDRPTRRTVLRLGVAGFAGAVGYSATASALENTLRIEAVGEAASYEFTVSGDLEPGPDFDTDGTDSISGSSASGTIAGTSGDDYTFSGEITQFSYDGNLRVFVNGERVDPATLGSGSGGSGSDGLTNELIVADPDGSQPNDYRFTVSGDVERLDDPRGDDADGDSARGTVYGGRDGYRFSGEVTSFTADGEVEVTVNGERVDPDSFASGGDGESDGSDGDGSSGGGDGGTRTLTFEGSPGGAYEFTVSGTLEKSTAMGASINSGDEISGSSADGGVGGGRDSYAFTGDIERLRVDDGVTVYLDGERVDPDTLGDGSGGGDGSGDETGRELIVADPDGSQLNDYEFRVTGTVKALDDPQGDHASGDSARGTVYGGRDGYRFTGEVASFSYEGEIDVTIDDQQVDPDTLGESSEGGGDPGDLTNELIVSDPDGSQPNDYEFTVNGIVEALDDPRGDHANGDSASGTVYGGRDGYRFSGEVTSFSYDGKVDVSLNGERVDPATLGHDTDDGDSGTRTLTFEGAPGGAYEFSVSGSLEKSTAMGASINSGDEISGQSADGGVGGGRDSYTYSGEITAFRVDDGVRVYLDGSEVDPDALGGGSDGTGDGTTSTLRIDAVGEAARYEVAVDGDLEPGPKFDAGSDSISGSSGAGTVGGRGTDDFVFSGSITRFSSEGPLRVFVDGQEVDPDALGDGSGGPGGASTEIVVADPDGSQPNDYEFRVTGTVEALDDPQGDDTDGDSASGTVYGGRDGYRFSGEITSFTYDGEVEVTIDGQPVDPDALGDDDGARGGENGKARVILSFDDGVPSAASVAKPIMDRYGYPGVAGIVTGRTQESGDDPDNLTVEELRGLQTDGWEVASHTIDHTKLTSVSRSEVRRQCRESREFIAENGLLPADPTLIYPYGGVNDRVVAIADDYFEYGFGGGDDDPADGIDAPLDIDRAKGHVPADARDQIDRAIEHGSQGVAVLMFHRIGTFDDPNPNDTSKAEFVDLVEYVDARSDEVDVVTASEL